MKKTLYWVTNDLRVNDNRALALASQSASLLCIYVMDERWLKPNNFQSTPLGTKRSVFLKACLHDFNQSLNNFGQQLYIVSGDTLSSLKHLCDEFQITDLVTTKVPGTYENNIITKLAQHQSQLRIHQVEQYTLLTTNILPFSVNDLPNTYSKFKNKVSDLVIDKINPVIQSLPAVFNNASQSTLLQHASISPADESLNQQIDSFIGGEQPALAHLNRYFSSDLPREYKLVRNHLDGWNNSTKLSAWINHGCLSAKQVYQAIKQFEEAQGSNSSTEHLHLELLWRDYFQWVHYKFGSKLYLFSGLYNQTPLTSFYPERFKKWCSGNTPYSLVNACMKELRETGYLSNRGRQIVASCLVNELSVDWRYGAAWFEQHLIDYDAAVNWGNWQYIAGVGVDPRGGRHFNLSKQTQIHDPHGAYQQKWLKDENLALHLDSVDASDWPIGLID
jgi:deoxyribodipyrimidine photo-lyase